MQSVDATDVPCHISLTADLQIKWECKTQFIWVTVYLNLAITSYTPTPLQRHNYSMLLTTWAPMGPMGGLLNLWWCLSIACNRLVTLNPPKAVTWDKRKHRNGKMNHKVCTGQGIQVFKNAYWITDIDIWNCASSCVKRMVHQVHMHIKTSELNKLSRPYCSDSIGDHGCLNQSHDASFHCLQSKNIKP